tara:strand:+ start:168 stop:581 length:414 start_codon:yes stop_codon:yes gene_type:complete
MTDTERGVMHGYGEKPKLKTHLQNVADMYGRLAEHTTAFAEAAAWVPTTGNVRHVPERDYLFDALSARDASRQAMIAELRGDASADDGGTNSQDQFAGGAGDAGNSVRSEDAEEANLRRLRAEEASLRAEEANLKRP